MKKKPVLKEFRGVPGFSQTADYHSPSPLMGVAPVEDAHLVRYCVKEDCLDLVDQSWKCTILATKDRKIQIRNKSFKGGIWFIPLGKGAGSCC